MEEIKSYKMYRHDSNPKEKEIYDKFIEHCSHNHNTMSNIVFAPADGGMRPQDYLIEREERIVVSVIQWLGSPVGQGFLRDCGFVPEKK